MRSKKLLYLVANDRYFCSHRLSLALAAKQPGYEITVVAPALGDHHRIIEAGLNFVPLHFNRGGLNPFSELKTIYRIWRIYRQIQPQIVHHVALKPVLYGSIASFLCPIPRVINAVAGLGHVFATGSWLKMPLRILLRLLLGRQNTQTIVQNPEDSDEISALTHSSKVHLILGAGVNLKEFIPQAEPAGPITVIHVSRLLWTKGIKELVEAHKILKEKGYNLRVWVVGEPDQENPAAIPAETLQQWHQEGLIEWLGHCTDIAHLYQQSHIAVLASYYREGIPKSLLEAAACGKPIITCDMPGCRIIVKDNTNGFLIPPRNPQALADALLKLINNPELRKKMGQASRQHAEEHFGEDMIHQQTIDLYGR